MKEKSLYQTLLDQGVPQTDIGNHYSDLYVRVTRKTKEIIQGYIQRNGLKGMPKVFRSNIAGEGYWYDIPFAYIPFWEERIKKRKGAGTMKILSFGAGMQSTALALMSCDNAIAQTLGRPVPFPKVPVYDAVIICDLGFEPPWVQAQADFVGQKCRSVGIFYTSLDAPLYQDLMRDFGKRRVVSIPWWTLSDDGHKSKMPRNCTLDYKVDLISKYVRWELLGYRKGQRLKEEDKKAHEMHMGFSAEEKQRCKENPNPMFVNRFPLVDMQLERRNNYAYIKDVWGLDTKASACCFCPFHRNYFFQYLKLHEQESYQKLVEVDNLLRDNSPKPPVNSELFISRSRKRLGELTPQDCNDAECFALNGRLIWNGF